MEVLYLFCHIYYLKIISKALVSFHVYIESERFKKWLRLNFIIVRMNHCVETAT